MHFKAKSLFRIIPFLLSKIRFFLHLVLSRFFGCCLVLMSNLARIGESYFFNFSFVSSLSLSLSLPLSILLLIGTTSSPTSFLTLRPLFSFLFLSESFLDNQEEAPPSPRGKVNKPQRSSVNDAFLLNHNSPSLSGWGNNPKKDGPPDASLPSTALDILSVNASQLNEAELTSVLQQAGITHTSMCSSRWCFFWLFFFFFFLLCFFVHFLSSVCVSPPPLSPPPPCIFVLGGRVIAWSL